VGWGFDGYFWWRQLEAAAKGGCPFRFGGGNWFGVSVANFGWSCFEAASKGGCPFWVGVGCGAGDLEWRSGAKFRFLALPKNTFF